MPTHKVFYFSHAPENVYAIIREEVPPGFENAPFETDGFDNLQTLKLVEDAYRLAGLPTEYDGGI